MLIGLRKKLFTVDKVPINNGPMDWWSVLHVIVGAGLGWIIAPIPAFTIMLIYEPIELFILFPLCYIYGGFVFGNESFKNSFFDLLFNTIGILIGVYILRILVTPPFVLFEGGLF